MNFMSNLEHTLVAIIRRWPDPHLVTSISLDSTRQCVHMCWDGLWYRIQWNGLRTESPVIHIHQDNVYYDTPATKSLARLLNRQTGRQAKETPERPCHNTECKCKRSVTQKFQDKQDQKEQENNVCDPISDPDRHSG